MPLDELLAQVDALTLHCPLNEHTRDFIGARELALLKPGAFVVNTARGGLINEQALADALRSGHLGGAATDVLSVEPPVHGNPLLAGDIPRLIVTPHNAWGSREARQRIVGQLAENARGFSTGPRCASSVDKLRPFKEQTMDPRSEVLLRQAELFQGNLLLVGLPADDLLGRLPNAHGWSWHAGDQAALDARFAERSHFGVNVPERAFDAAVIFLPKSKDLTDYLLNAVAARLPAAELFLVGEKKPASKAPPSR